jgi:hypothetical protein
VKKLDRPVLAEGEVTNHFHVIDAPATVFDMENGTREFSVDSSVTVRHEEHGPIDIPAGDYASGIVQEYDHMAEEARQVQD